MADPNFLTRHHADIKAEILQDYITERPAADAEEASDIDIKADILAGNVKQLEWGQFYILRQIFAESAEMPYLILAARNIAGIDWDDGTRARGYVKLSRSTPAGADLPIAAGTVLISGPDGAGNIIRAALLYDATIPTGQTYTIGIAEVIEIQAEPLLQYTIPSSAGGDHLVAEQEAGSGLAGNIPDGTLISFEAAPPAGVEEVENFSPGKSEGKGWTSATLFTITGGVNDKIRVNLNGAGASQITLAAGANLSGAQVAADIQAKVRAIGGGGYAAARCLYNMTGEDFRFILFSGTAGAGSSAAITAGDNDARATLGFDQLTEAAGGYGFTGGIDPQTKESLRAEYETALELGGEAGTAADYATWARNSGQGVDDAKVTGLVGAVAVFPVSDSGALFSQGQLDAILAYIETKCPVHLVGSITVENPEVLSIYVSATLVLESGFALGDVSAAVKTAIADYIRTVPIGDLAGSAIVRVSKISAAILGVNGVLDVANLLVDDVDPPVAAVNIVLADGEVAQTDDGKLDLA